MKLKLQHNPVEIERKFLVATDDWRRSVVRSVHIRDGLIAAYKNRKVRVRIAGRVATIAIKGPRSGLARAEYEYEIPSADAEHMLSTICRDDILEKERFFVEEIGVLWHVDVYGGILKGVVIAEIELTQESEQLQLPSWIGKEVTGDFAYKKINMLAQRRRGPVSVPPRGTVWSRPDNSELAQTSDQIVSNECRISAARTAPAFDCAVRRSHASQPQAYFVGGSKRWRGAVLDLLDAGVGTARRSHRARASVACLA